MCGPLALVLVLFLTQMCLLLSLARLQLPQIDQYVSGVRLISASARGLYDSNSATDQSSLALVSAPVRPRANIDELWRTFLLLWFCSRALLAARQMASRNRSCCAHRHYYVWPRRPRQQWLARQVCLTICLLTRNDSSCVYPSGELPSSFVSVH